MAHFSAREMAQFSTIADKGTTITDAGKEGFQLGYVGWIPYEFAEASLNDTVDALSDIRAPSIIRVETALSIDNVTGRAELLVRAEFWPGAAAARREDVVDWLTLATKPAVQEQRQQSGNCVPSQNAVIWRDDADSYVRKVATCKDEIAAGNGYVICLTTEVSAEGD